MTLFLLSVYLLLDQCLRHLCPTHRTVQFSQSQGWVSSCLRACPLPWGLVSLVTDEPSFPPRSLLLSPACSLPCTAGYHSSNLLLTCEIPCLINHRCLCHSLWLFSFLSELVQVQPYRVQPNSAWWKFPTNLFYSSVVIRHWTIMSLHRLKDGP